ncbi:hypothetical protein N7513_005910 [Penicillium frequentans]|nr:hypothetical protein N7513_005910 [Penicillium glabrum]
MDQFNLDFTSRDDSQEEGGVSLPQSLPQDPLMAFPNPSGNYGYGAMLSQDANIPPECLWPARSTGGPGGSSL